MADDLQVPALVDEARRIVIAHQPGAKQRLYGKLVIALRICELCERPAELAALDKMIDDLPVPRGHNRQYVEKQSDIYQRVCRFVFHGEEHSANTNRYAICLRQAVMRGVDSSALSVELNRGGINRFYLARELPTERIATKCIRLDRQITHERGALFTLTLRRLSDNTYEVLSPANCVNPSCSVSECNLKR